MHFTATPTYDIVGFPKWYKDRFPNVHQPTGLTHADRIQKATFTPRSGAPWKNISVFARIQLGKTMVCKHF